MLNYIENVIGMAEELGGFTPGSFHWTSRKQDIHCMRMASCNLIMRELGIDYNELSKHITSRDRATFYYWYKQHDDYLSGWDMYEIYYSTLKSKWLNTDYDDEEYMDAAKFEMILYRNAIPKTEANMPTKLQKVRFKVLLGNFNANIYRTPASAPNCLKKMLAAFSRYKKLKITINKIQKYERIYQAAQENSRN